MLHFELHYVLISTYYTLKKDPIYNIYIYNHMTAIELGQQPSSITEGCVVREAVEKPIGGSIILQYTPTSRDMDVGGFVLAFLSSLVWSGRKVMVQILRFSGFYDSVLICKDPTASDHLHSLSPMSARWRHSSA